MSGASKKLMGTTAVGGSALAIEDVFSTYLYTGNGTSQTITNGIDLAGEGGLVWIKNRPDTGYSHYLADTERGIGSTLFTNLTNGSISSTAISAFNSDGFSVSNNTEVNQSGKAIASWTFRKAPRFFDVVTWTGDGVNGGRQIPHNLGVTPGCIIVKQTNTTSNWGVYHRSLPLDSANETASVLLNSTSAYGGYGWFREHAAQTDTYFTIRNASTANTLGATYVAYLFAHDPLGPSGDGSDGLIACGSFTTDGSGNVGTVELGWEPQFVLFKTTTSTTNWLMWDTMRGMSLTSQSYLNPNSAAAEATLSGSYLYPTSTGFNGSGNLVGANQTCIYIAIRRGPMRQPTSGTEVFAMDTLYSPGSNAPKWDATMPVVDMAIVAANISSSHNTGVYSRLTQGKYLKSNTADAEASTADLFDAMYGWAPSATSLGPLTTYPSWMFRRAPGFFDIAAYSGNAVAGRTVPHNLGVAPEMIIVKCRNAAIGWQVYHAALGNTGGLYLNTTTNPSPVLWWNSTDPSSTEFTLGSTTGNNSGGDFIAYLFATLPGVSKVGSYTGNGSSQTINCGFTSGARFVLIKRTDSTGDWYVWNTARGIVAGNDPYLSLNTTVAEVTTDDSVDPDNSGFIVNQVAATNINVSSASYIYLAIA